jgi:hypothetical protein
LIVQISEGLFPKEAGRLAQTLNLLSRTEGR